jgi:hypothetical protein
VTAWTTLTATGGLVVCNGRDVAVLPDGTQDYRFRP